MRAAINLYAADVRRSSLFDAAAAAAASVALLIQQQANDITCRHNIQVCSAAVADSLSV